MLVNGDKLVVKKSIMGILNEGDIAKVINANENGLIRFAFGDNFMHMGLMSSDEFERHFEKVVEEAPKVTREQIDEIIDNSEFEVSTVFDKCTVVSCRLPNGFVITESSACVSPENYNEELGFEICFEKIENKIWELEGYRLQEELYRKTRDTADINAYDYCEEAECSGCDECNYCREYDCPNNTMS